jgi:hypothetical protein
MKIVVCGDSYCASDMDHPGVHFSELLNGSVLNLARQGASNSAIFCQFNEALQMQPDVIVYGMTDPSRMLAPNPTRDPDKPSWSTPAVLKNIRYGHHDGYPTHEQVLMAGGERAPFISHTIDTLVTNKQVLAGPREVIDAIKYYHAYLFDHNMQDWFDREMYHGYCARAELKNIKTISLQEACPFVYEVSLTYQGEFSGSFHTDAETQQRVAQVLQGVINVN